LVAALFRRQQFHDPEEGVDSQAAAGDMLFTTQVTLPSAPVFST
jgi:hypothetical protein